MVRMGLRLSNQAVLPAVDSTDERASARLH